MMTQHLELQASQEGDLKASEDSSPPDCLLEIHSPNLGAEAAVDF